MSIKLAKHILNHPAHISLMGSNPLESRKVKPLLAAGFALALSFLAALPSPVSAHEIQIPQSNTPHSSVDSNKKEYPIYFDTLGSFISQKDESKDDFLIRVSHFMRDYTDKTGWEVCGVIQENASNKKEYAIQVVTNASKIACLSVDIESPTFVSTDERIHTHPRVGLQYASLQDSRMLGIPCGQRMQTNPFDFSPQDLKSESGYLVTPSRFASKKAQLLYQKDGKIELISNLKNSATISTPSTAQLGNWKAIDNIQLNSLSAAPTSFNPNMKLANKCKPF